MPTPCHTANRSMGIVPIPKNRTAPVAGRLTEIIRETLTQDDVVLTV